MPLLPAFSRLLAPFVAAVALVGPASAAAAAIPASSLEETGIREVIVKRERGLGAAGRARLRESVDGVLVRHLPLADTEVLRIPAGRLNEALARLAASPDVVYAEGNAPVRAYSDDTHWRYQWGLENTGQDVFGYLGTPDADIDAPEAWPTSVGTGIGVGIVDTGVHATHLDLVPRLTGNPGEIGAEREANGVDDDGNGYIDDHRGWDFVSGLNEGDTTPGPDSSPADPDGHGTHVAGIVAAERDNQRGIAGSAPGAGLIALRALGDDGSGSLADVASAFVYAGELRLPVVNASLGSESYSLTLHRAIKDHPGTLFVAAAGNGGDDGIGDDVDSIAEYPCAIPEDNVLCVGASDSDDRRADFSNFGSTTVDLFAPGVDVVSTYSAPDTLYDGCAAKLYCALSGTSMAAPHAAAVAALVASIRPDLRGAGLREALVDGAEVKASLGGTMRRRLNAALALEGVGDGDSDGVDNRSDNCAALSNPTQSDADADGLGDACDATPEPSSTPVPSPTPVPSTAPAPSPTPTPSAPLAPRPETAQPAEQPLRLAARLSSRTLGRRGSVVASLRTSEPAFVTLRVTRGGSRRVLVTLRGASRPSGSRLVIKRRSTVRRLAPGRHLVTVTAGAGERTASTRLALVVR